MSKPYYNTANAEERREFFGIDTDAMKGQEFSLKSRDEVLMFSKFLDDYVNDEAHLPFHGIDLLRWYDKCVEMGNDGGRLFSAILDLKITYAFVFIDYQRIVPGLKVINQKETPDVLADSMSFKEKMNLLHGHIDMAIRYRSFYDKFMGVLVLLLCPDKYNKFASARSHKSDFRKLMEGHIDSENLDSLYTIISGLDNDFRTAEAHQTGRMRKWVLGGRDCFVDNVLNLGGYFNNILSLANWLDELIDG